MTDDPIVVPDVAEAIVAYRSWNASERDGLRGFNGGLWVPGGVTEAFCARDGMYSGRRLAGSPCPVVPCPPDTIGHAGHGCGLYATKRDAALDVAPPATSDDAYGYYDGRASGIVRLWGRYYEYEDGYRAQFGEVAAIYDSGPHCEVLAELYQCDLLPWPVESLDDRRVRLQREAAEQRARHLARVTTSGKSDPPDGVVPAVQGDTTPDDGLTIGRTEGGYLDHQVRWEIRDADGNVLATPHRFRWYWPTLDAGKFHDHANRALERVRYKRAHPIKRPRVALMVYCALYAVVFGGHYSAKAFTDSPWWGIVALGCVALGLYGLRLNWRRRRD